MKIVKYLWIAALAGSLVGCPKPEECDNNKDDDKDDAVDCEDSDCAEAPECAFCGDGNVNPGEECDNGEENSNTQPDACREDCALPSCGDGTVDSQEECDDGNTNPGDGCDAQCQIEHFFNTAPLRVSGDLVCNTAFSNSGRKIAVDETYHLYVALNCQGHLYVSTSYNGGRSYTAPVSVGISDLAEVAIEGGPEETVYLAALQNNGQLIFMRSVDAGQSWEPPVVMMGAVYDYLSLATFGDAVYLLAPSMDVLRLFVNESRGAGAFRQTDLPNTGVYGDVLVGPSGEVFVAIDTPLYTIHRSLDGGVSFEPPVSPPGAAYYSDWSISDELIYTVGTYLDESIYDAALEIDLIPLSDLTTSTQAVGLPFSVITQSRAVSSNRVGDIFVVSKLTDGTVALDKVPSWSGIVELSKSKNFGAGSYPGVVALPTNNGAAVVFTVGTEVYAATVLYPPCEGECERCGDGVPTGLEECDDGNNLNEDGCSAACRVERCGDGVVQPGEECDDGNTNNGDGCSASCLTCEGVRFDPGNGILGCWYTSPTTGMSCNEVCSVHGGFDAIASQHTGNEAGMLFWPEKIDGDNWLSIECSSTDNNTNWGANGQPPDANFAHGFCHVNCACYF